MLANDKKLDKKSKGLIVAIFAILILMTFSAVMLIAVYNLKGASFEDDTTSVGMNNDISYIASNTTEKPTLPIHSTTEGSSRDDVTSTTGNTETQAQVSVEGLEEFTKTGDNQISDSPKNRFIKLVVENYDVDTKNLVAIYAVPDLGNNFVLEFDGKKDAEGNVIRSQKTLKKIYHINKEGNITVATGKPIGNEGVDYGTSIMTYYLITDVVMPEFPDYFTGV